MMFLIRIVGGQPGTVADLQQKYLRVIQSWGNGKAIFNIGSLCLATILTK